MKQKIVNQQGYGPINGIGTLVSEGTIKLRVPANFKKDAEERLIARRMKQEHNKMMNWCGIDKRKYLNYE